jgi:prepilin-type N-terminal cleavage/methylation domain-containing protein
MNKINNKSQSGFSLVELLVVISIIGTLAGLLITNLVGVRGRAADSKIKNNARQLKTALRLYYNDYQQYPNSTSGSLDGCGTGGDTACTEGGTFSAGSGPTIYMQELPASFTYTVGTDNETFVIGTTLSNVSDADVQASATACGQTYTSSSSAYFVCND